MARSLNQVFLLGNLTRDPEMRQTSNGQTVCNFGLALNRSFKRGDQWEEATDFVNVVAWGPLGERVGQYLTKGRRVLVQGSLRSSSWEQDGQKRNKLEVWANDVTFLDGRGGEGTGEANGEAAPRTSGGTSRKKATDDVVIEDIGGEINLDDIPF